MAFQHRHVVNLINKGRLRVVLLFFLLNSAVISLLLLGGLYFTPGLEQRHGVIIGIAAAVFSVLLIDSIYVVWVTGRICPMDTPRALRRRCYLVFGFTNSVALLVGLVVGRASASLGIISALAVLVILPWVLGRRLRNAFFDAV